MSLEEVGVVVTKKCHTLFEWPQRETPLLGSMIFVSSNDLCVPYYAKCNNNGNNFENTIFFVLRTKIKSSLMLETSEKTK